MKINIEEAAQPQVAAHPQRKESGWFWLFVIVCAVAVVSAAVWSIGRDVGWFETVYTAPVATIMALPTDAPRATSLPVQPAQSSGGQQVQPEQGGSVPAPQPVQPATVEQPAPIEYIAPAVAIPQPTADPWYQGTIKDYSDRSPCSMPRANPQTCAGDVPPLPWPNGRAP